MTSNINLFILTYNCAKAFLDTKAFSYGLISALSSPELPDLVVLSLQEIAPLPYAFIGGSRLSPYLSRFYDAVKSLTKHRELDNAPTYTTIATHHVGQTCIIVFAKNASAITDVETTGIGVGLLGIGSKGAVGVRLKYQNTSLTFVALHLAAMEWELQRRNEDWKKIVQGLIFSSSVADQADDKVPLLLASSKDASIYKATSHLFVAGDLNYRTSSLPPSEIDFISGFPQPNVPINDKRHFENLLKLDQLNQERLAGQTCHGLNEAKITFPPTYKYNVKKENTLNAEIQEKRWDWAANRWPSWCDRILYLDLPMWLKRVYPKAQLTVLSYNALRLLPNSDHRPVALEINISMVDIPEPNDDEESDDPRIRPPFGIDIDSQGRRARIRKLELFIGWALWLTTTCDGFLYLAVLMGLLGAGLLLKSKA